jgi:signal transduction histidine kinase
MEKTPPEIGVAIVIACLVLIILSVFLLLFLLFFLNRKKKLFKEKALMQQQFQTELIKTQFEVQEQTRKNLAADLHDNIGQILSLTNVTLASINPDDKEKTRQKIEVTQELVTRSIRELRQLSKIIHGEQLIKQGLVQTIEQEISWLQRNGHYTVEFTHDLPDGGISNTDKDLFLYRLLQESLNNIIKHSGANIITIHLTYADHSLRLMIADNGFGFNAKEKLNQEGGLGLLNMQKRVALLNGTIEINTAENKGTSIIFSIPYP